MKRMTYFVMALVLVLGFSQCKKEQPLKPTNENNVVRITLDVENSGNNGSRAEVNPPHVTFKNGDRILVAYDGKYVGYLDHNGTKFIGNITVTQNGDQNLYFYFLGNKADVSTLVTGTTEECTVNISDQTYETEYMKLPVISMAPSNETYPSVGNTYTAHLHNKASLMKFSVTTPSDANICITGMNNTVTVKLNDRSENDGFSYDMDAEDGGLIKMKGQTGSGEKTYWAIVLPQAELDETGEAYSEDFSYTGTRPTIHAIESNKYYHEGADVISMTVNTHVWNGNLAALTGSEQEGFATARNGMTVYGTLSANVKVSIADGATVTFNGANINNNNSKSGNINCAGITCLGNATINLYGGSIIHCSSNNYPGIQAGPQGNTLTIQGTGSLNVQGGSNAAGIGGGSGITCGNISLMGGAITACGGQYGAGIGSGQGGTCGNIEIVGGEITATGGEGAAGIGSGSGINTVCGNIYLYGGTINVCGGDGAAGIGSGSGGTCSSIEIEGGTITAQGGSNAAGIGSGQNGHCGNVEIEGGSINATGGEGAGNIGAGEGGECGTVTLHPINGLFSVSSTRQVRFSRGNLLSDGSFAVNQYTYGDYFSASNSYNGPAGWDALTTDEWNYLYQHSTFGFATVNGIHGLIILPNNYTGSSITEYDPQDGSRILWNDNTYSGDAWTAMENNGVVFLPAAGYYKTNFPGMGLNNQGDEGCYLSSSGSVYFRFVNKKEDIYVGGTDPWSTSITPNESGSTQYQYSVRLVRTN